ncbi:MAG: ATP-binding protein [Roseburia sp.]|nr:ATP-binding protein [Roseburia sp.]
MIVKPEKLTFADKKIRMLIAGFPGIGKTTLALSAPKPLYIDVDLSAERINREVLNLAAGITQPRDYEELRRDLGLGCSDMELQGVKNSLAEYETIVVDTGGKLLTIMGQYGKKIEPKYGQRDGSLSLKGYGWLGKEFQRFLDHIIYQLDKHIVIVFHTVEDKDGDDTKLRIKAEGSSKNSVWEVMDLGGFIEIRGNQRTIGFSNCDRYFAKGTRGVHGVYTIPELAPGVPNDFLSKLFEQYNALSAEEQAQGEANKAAYEAAMTEGRAIIDSITDAETANAAMPKIKAITHALTSEKEIGVAFNAKIKECGLFYDKVLKKYTPAPDKEGAK